MLVFMLILIFAVRTGSIGLRCCHSRELLPDPFKLNARIAGSSLSGMWCSDGDQV